MSTQLHEIPTIRGEMTITRFYAGDKNGQALQLTQNSGHGADATGFIQLNRADVEAVIPLLLAWLNGKAGPQPEALEAVLLFHSGSPWDESKKQRWQTLTGGEATTKVLCNTVRAALAPVSSGGGGGVLVGDSAGENQSGAGSATAKSSDAMEGSK